MLFCSSFVLVKEFLSPSHPRHTRMNQSKSSVKAPTACPTLEQKAALIFSQLLTRGRVSCGSSGAHLRDRPLGSTWNVVENSCTFLFGSEITPSFPQLPGGQEASHLQGSVLSILTLKGMLQSLFSDCNLSHQVLLFIHMLFNFAALIKRIITQRLLFISFTNVASLPQISPA